MRRLDGAIRLISTTTQTLPACKDQIDQLKELKCETDNERKIVREVIAAAETRTPPDIDDLGCSATDDRTLVLKLEHPAPYFLDLVGLPAFFPLPRAVMDKHNWQWTRPEYIVSNGPFELDENEDGEKIVLRKNLRYWNAEAVKQQVVWFLEVESSATAFRMYEKGDIDILMDLPRATVKKLANRDDYQTATAVGTCFYAFNVTEAPFSDVRVRRALALAINRSKLVEESEGWAGKPAYHLVPPLFKGFKHSRAPGK